MPYEVLVLRAGYCRECGDDSGKCSVKCTITLLRGHNHNIIVDPGSPWDKEFLEKSLKEHGIKPEEIDYVIGTHGHLDHIGLLSMFPHSTMIIGHDVCKNEVYQQHPFNENMPYIIDDYLVIESTPGHTSEDVTVYVQSSDPKLGTVAVAGDIFESEADLDDPTLWQNQSQFPEAQQKSRLKILKRADTIIPGHGALFYTPKKYKEDPHMVMVMYVHEEITTEVEHTGIPTEVL